MRRRMKLLEKTNEEILKIANPIWDNLVKSSNVKDYSGFTKDFLGCLKRNNFVTVLFKQKSDTVPGEFLGRLVLGVEDDKVKVFGATIF